MQGKKVSKPIVRISVISIALAVIVNLITLAVVTGFQQEVRQKVSGFGSHIVIMSAGENSVYESEPIRKEQNFVSTLAKDPAIASINPVAYKPVLFQSGKQELNYTLADGTDTTESQYQVHGAVIKGVDTSFNWAFFEQHLIDGTLPDFSSDSTDDHIVISKKLAKDLQFEVGETVGAFFVRNQPVKRNYKVVGIYETGLDEFDKQIVLGKLSTVQELNDWGIHANIDLMDSLVDGQIIVRAQVSGGNGNYRYDWGDGFNGYSGLIMCPTEDTTIRLIASDYWSNLSTPIEETTLPDTAFITIKVKGDKFTPCSFELNEVDVLEKNYLDETGNHFEITSGNKTFEIQITPGKGSSDHYIGAYEMMVTDWDQLETTLTSVQRMVDLKPTPFDEILMTSSIMENQRDIFVWLGFLDINVAIILVLMILIGIINMGSALLVLILIRSNFIGMMKAIGANNWSIRKIFLYQAGFLIGRGMIIGNVIGLGFCFLQKYTGFISLNPEVYYLSEVPIQLNPIHWILLNVGTLVVCLAALIIPSVVITRISPVKAIKFN